jgi:Zn-dependent protease with chaperone function
MRRDSVGDIQEIRAEKSKNIRTLKTAMFLPDFIAIGSFFLALNFIVGIVFSRPSSFSITYIAGLIGLAALYAYLLARFQYSVARKNGALFILKRFSVKPLDLKNSFHGQYLEIVEEMTNAAGLPKINIHVVSSPSINALALVEPGGKPCLALTEGLLAGYTQDEIKAVVAREIALIDHGDALYKTLVCSLADFLERFRSAFDRDQPEEGSLSFSLSSRIRRFLSRYINPEQEIQADAAAVRLGQNPVTLAQALAKSFAVNSSKTDLGHAYAPLFFIPPETAPGSQDAAGWLAGIYPPLLTRIRRLAIMADQKTEDIIPQDILQGLMKIVKNI